MDSILRNSILNAARMSLRTLCVLALFVMVACLPQKKADEKASEAPSSDTDAHTPELFADFRGHTIDQNLAGIAFDSHGDLFVSDRSGHRILKYEISTSSVSVYAGTGSEGEQNGERSQATFKLPSALLFDANDNLFVAQAGYSGNHGPPRIRKITADGTVSTFAVLPGEPGFIVDMVFDGSGGIVLATTSRVWKVNGGASVSDFSGDGVAGHVDAGASSARFYQITSIEEDGDGNFLIGEMYPNGTIYDGYLRKVDGFGTATTLWTGFGIPHPIVLLGDRVFVTRSTQSGDVNMYEVENNDFTLHLETPFTSNQGSNVIEVGPDDALYYHDDRRVFRYKPRSE